VVKRQRVTEFVQDNVAQQTGLADEAGLQADVLFPVGGLSTSADKFWIEEDAIARERGVLKSNDTIDFGEKLVPLAGLLIDDRHDGGGHAWIEVVEHRGGWRGPGRDDA
jgi:hypothetical protein